ncbi:MAG: InlB B-repeat-containing protein [Candidatus Symbiothrix sp.]|jgi:uncharacterized repeat protein (TIGR02543 family)|nr:InlB B-repeat-containing protein [Candidatus Symbiothrix sp.]
MKKITLLLMACCMSVMTFAAGGNITYVLNGGVTNDYGWTNKADMLVTFNQDYNTANNVAETATWYTWETLDVILAAADPVVRIPTFAASGFYVVLTSPKWQWLHDYIVATGATQSIAAIEEADNAYWRYETSAFFVNGQRTSWPASASYVIAGQTTAFVPSWKHAFAGPATYDGSVAVVIPDPYKEGESFLGWYKNADFSGEKVTSIPAGTEGDITLYAKFGAYIPTCAEVWALTGATDAQGVVTYINGTVAYIQDASAGLEVTFAAAPGIVAGDKITVSGTAAAGGKLTGAAVTAKESASLPTAQTLLLSAVLTDAANQYTNELVYIEGLKITAVDASTLTLTDETNTIVLKAAGISYAVGKKVNVKAVALFDGTTHSLTGPASFVALAAAAAQDPYSYPAKTVSGNTYTLKNNWLISNIMDNFSANPIASAAQMVRGMAAKNGKIYFPDRGLHQLTVIEGATGERLPAIVLNDAVYFKYTDSEGAVKDAGTLRYNDIKLDAAGHILLGNCITSNAQPFQVWKVDETTGEGKLIISEILLDNPDYAPLATARIDAFGVYGDVEGNGYIIAANSNGFEVFKWVIENGVAGDAELITIDNGVEGTGLTGLNPSSWAPQTYPVDENYFYVDYFGTLATLVDMNGNYVDGFYDNGTLIAAATDDAGRTVKTGGNGVTEFEFGGEYYLLISSTDGAAAPGYAYRLFKYADANREFKNMTSLWTFPDAGMGTASNGARAVVSSVEVTADVATIYVYSVDNGYGVYELKIDGGTAIHLVNKDAVNVIVSGNQVRLSENAADIKVFNLVGQLVQKAQGKSSITIANRGIYIVSVQTLKGEIITKKVIIK